MREQLHEQSERLTSEISQLRKQYADKLDNATRKANWLAGSNVLESTGQRLSEITIDLVSESEYDDDEEENNEFRKKRVPIVELADEDEKPVEEVEAEILLPIKLIGEFKENLSTEEQKLFSKIEDAFGKFLNQTVELAVKGCEHGVQAEKNEKDAEIARLTQLLSNIKSGSVEVKEMRQELDAIHKKEMEDLRQYFERKCTDLEKQ